MELPVQVGWIWSFNSPTTCCGCLSNQRGLSCFLATEGQSLDHPVNGPLGGRILLEVGPNQRITGQHQNLVSGMCEAACGCNQQPGAECFAGKSGSTL